MSLPDVDLKRIEIPDYSVFPQFYRSVPEPQNRADPQMECNTSKKISRSTSA